MRDPRIEPMAGDVFCFEDGEVVKVTSASKQWITFDSSELGTRLTRANRFRQMLSMHDATAIPMDRDE